MKNSQRSIRWAIALGVIGLIFCLMWWKNEALIQSQYNESLHQPTQAAPANFTGTQVIKTEKYGILGYIGFQNGEVKFAPAKDFWSSQQGSDPKPGQHSFIIYGGKVVFNKVFLYVYYRVDNGKIVITDTH